MMCLSCTLFHFLSCRHECICKSVLSCIHSARTEQCSACIEHYLRLFILTFIISCLFLLLLMMLHSQPYRFGCSFVLIAGNNQRGNYYWSKNITGTHACYSTQRPNRRILFQVSGLILLHDTYFQCTSE